MAYKTRTNNNGFYEKKDGSSKEWETKHDFPVSELDNVKCRLYDVYEIKRASDVNTTEVIESMSVVAAVQMLLLQTHKPVNVEIEIDDVIEMLVKDDTYRTVVIDGVIDKFVKQLDAKHIVEEVMENPTHKQAFIDAVSTEAGVAVLKQSEWDKLREDVDTLTYKCDEGFSTLNSKIKVLETQIKEAEAQIELRRASSVS